MIDGRWPMADDQGPRKKGPRNEEKGEDGGGGGLAGGESTIGRRTRAGIDDGACVFGLEMRAVLHGMASGATSRLGDKHEVTHIDKHAKSLADHDDGIFAMDSVSEQSESSGEAEPPEDDGHDGIFLLLGSEPLSEESRREYGLTEKADGEPKCGIGFDVTAGRAHGLSKQKPGRKGRTGHGSSLLGNRSSRCRHIRLRGDRVANDFVANRSTHQPSDAEEVDNDLQ